MDSRNLRPLVIGVGNPWRGDDAVGQVIADRLERLASARFRVVRTTGEATELMHAWKDARRVILIDAVRSGAAVGTLHRLDPSLGPLPLLSARGSSHSFGVYEAIELARTLGRLPDALVIFGIEVKGFDHGDRLSPEVENVVEGIVQIILQELS
jgi:hydrogenase maturation protease